MNVKEPDEKHSHDSGKEKNPKAEKTEKSVLAEGTGGASPVVRFKIDGIVKSLNKPVTGYELYRAAGQPHSLSLGGKHVNNDAEPVEIEDDAELTSSR